jgi:hypothetical protein
VNDKTKRGGFRAAVSGIASVMAASAAFATPGAPAPSEEVSVSADLGLFSAYVWRGIVLNDEAVLQPSVTMGRGALSLNVWANQDLTDTHTNAGEFTEVDLALAFAKSVQGVDVELSLVEYLFPNSGAGSRSEFQLLVAPTTVALSPYVRVVYDFDRIDGLHLRAGISQSVRVTKTTRVEAGLSAGWGNADYNAGYFQVDEGALDDGVASLGLPLVLANGVAITPELRYSWLWDEQVKASVEDGGHEGSHTHFGVVVNYPF